MRLELITAKVYYFASVLKLSSLGLVVIKILPERGVIGENKTAISYYLKTPKRK